ncbi:unnamed protein product [Rangifer tarandus platyrhynchus]|uniref:DEAD/DEAH-box helicase domain-containing protein n=1 Tax=Rangifer tarandus platyrhynchus TaxID=3082113 RepID=A0ABN8XLV0_RANTA|nr:unnamed protein product [Rangifer tarandus platyrhynchus]
MPTASGWRRLRASHVCWCSSPLASSHNNFRTSCANISVLPVYLLRRQQQDNRTSKKLEHLWEGGGPSSGSGTPAGADVLITTPARLMLHLHKRNVNLRRVRAVVVEEADTLCDTFYEQELLFVLDALLHQVEAGYVGGRASAAALDAATAASGGAEWREYIERKQQTRLELLDSLKRTGISMRPQTNVCALLPPAAASSVGAGAAAAAVADLRPQLQLVFVAATKTGALGRFLREELRGLQLTTVCAPDAHMTNPGVQQVFVRLAGEDRIGRLLEVLAEKEEDLTGEGGADGRASAEGKKTIVFCNTVNSCRQARVPPSGLFVCSSRCCCGRSNRGSSGTVRAFCGGSQCC